MEWGLSLDEIECVEVLGGVVDFLLDQSLGSRAVCGLGLGQFNVVGGFDSDAIAVSILLVEVLIHTLVIISEDSPVLHQLDVASVERRTSLRSIIHDSKSQIVILDGNSRIDWIEVGRDVVVRSIVVHLDVPSGSVVADSLLHLETVRVSIECAMKWTVRVRPGDASINGRIELENHLV